MNVTVAEAKAQFDELITKASQGEAIVIVDGATPVAQLVPPAPVKPKPHFGRAKGMLTILCEDDDHLKDFEDYMP